MLWIFVTYVIYIWINVAIAIIHKDIRAYRIHIGSSKQINHPLWLAGYCILTGISWLHFHNLYLIGAVLLQHAWVFSPIFNLFIDMPPFNLSKTTTSLFDRLLVKFGLKSTEWAVLIMFLLSIALLIKSVL